MKINFKSLSRSQIVGSLLAVFTVALLLGYQNCGKGFRVAGFSGFSSESRGEQIFRISGSVDSNSGVVQGIFAEAFGKEGAAEHTSLVLFSDDGKKIPLTLLESASDPNTGSLIGSLEDQDTVERLINQRVSIVGVANEDGLFTTQSNLKLLGLNNTQLDPSKFEDFQTQATASVSSSGSQKASLSVSNVSAKVDASQAKLLTWPKTTTPGVTSKSVAVMIGNFVDRRYPFSPEDIYKYVFSNDPDSIRMRLEKMSGGKYTIHGVVFGAVTTENSFKDGCGIVKAGNLDKFGNDIEKNLTTGESYQVELVLTPDWENCWEAGFGGIAGATSGLKFYFLSQAMRFGWKPARAYVVHAENTESGLADTINTAFHEAGHIFGLGHSSLGEREYGDATCVMGSLPEDWRDAWYWKDNRWSRINFLFNPIQSERLGILPTSEKREVNSIGAFQIAARDAKNNGKGIPQILKFGKLHISFRSDEIPYLSDKLANKIHIHEWDNPNLLLQFYGGAAMKPKSLLRTILAPGEQFTDLRAGYTIKFESITNGVANIKVDRPSSIPPAPKLNLSLSKTQINKGESVFLSWGTEMADSVFVSFTGNSYRTGNNPNESHQDEIISSVEITPLESQTLQVIASGPGGQTVKDIEITVHNPNPPQCRLAAELNGVEVTQAPVGSTVTWKVRCARSERYMLETIKMSENSREEKFLGWIEGGEYSFTIHYPTQESELRNIIVKNLQGIELERTTFTRFSATAPNPPPPEFKILSVFFDRNAGGRSQIQALGSFGDGGNSVSYDCGPGENPARIEDLNSRQQINFSIPGPEATPARSCNIIVRHSQLGETRSVVDIPPILGTLTISSLRFSSHSEGRAYIEAHGEFSPSGLNVVTAVCDGESVTAGNAHPNNVNSRSQVNFTVPSRYTSCLIVIRAKDHTDSLGVSVSIPKDPSSGGGGGGGEETLTIRQKMRALSENYYNSYNWNIIYNQVTGLEGPDPGSEEMLASLGQIQKDPGSVLTIDEWCDVVFRVGYSCD